MRINYDDPGSRVENSTSDHPLSCTEHVGSLADMTVLIEKVAHSMAGAGFPRRDILSVRVALEEAIVNSFKHAYRHAPDRFVTIRHAVQGRQVLLEVEDQGAGFNPELIPDPTAPENWERESGRGIFLMRTYMNSVSFNHRGNCVTLCKYRSDANPGEKIS